MNEVYVSEHPVGAIHESPLSNPDYTVHMVGLVSNRTLLIELSADGVSSDRSAPHPLLAFTSLFFINSTTTRGGPQVTPLQSSQEPRR